MDEKDVQLGEGFVGPGPELAHVNTALGFRSGPVGTAWVTSLATPTSGFARFVAVIQPGVPVKPMTLFVNKAALVSDRHGQLTWGAAQAGVAKGVARALLDEVIDPCLADALALIVAVWVDPAASDESAVFANNDEATYAALLAGRDRAPTIGDVVAAIGNPHNPFFPTA